MEKETKQVNSSGIDLHILFGDALRAAKNLLWLGVLLAVESEGRMYPAVNQASAVLDALSGTDVDVIVKR